MPCRSFVRCATAATVARSPPAVVAPGTHHRTRHEPIRIARQAAFRAVLLDSGAGRLQRQCIPQCTGDVGGVPDGAGRPHCGDLHQPGAGSVHHPVLPVFRHCRPAGGEVREEPHHPLREAVRDRGDGAGCVRLLHPPHLAAAGGAVHDGHALDHVRADQVRDPAAGAEERGTGRRQRSGRDGHSDGDAGGHDRRQLADAGGRRRSPAGLRRDHRGGGGRLPGQPAHSGRAGDRA